MWRRHLKIMWNPIVLMVCAVIFAFYLTGCDVESEEPIDFSGSSIALPRGLDPRELPSGVMAMAIIPELSTQVPLAMDDEKAVGSFPILPAGIYTVIVRFSSNDFILAQSEKKVDYRGSSQILDFNDIEYDYPDDDGDRYSNLTEILIQKNPAEKTDKPTPRRVFITSVEGPADLSTWSDAGGQLGIQAGDNICQTRAELAGLKGTFQAWLSDDNNDAYCRVAGLSGKKGSETCNTGGFDSGPYVRTDEFPFAWSLEQLVAGEVLSAIQVDEAGQNHAGDSLSVWTATDSDGKINKSDSNCNNWTSMDDSASSVNGRGDRSVSRWTFSASTGCGDSASLYCFQVSPGDSVRPLYKTINAKKVFVTSSAGSGELSSWTEANGQSGFLAGKQICQTLASEAGFKNADKFIPWLSDSTDAAVDRLQGEGPWVRPDGIVVAKTKADLLDGFVINAIAQTEQESYISRDVWTGSNPSGRCKDCGSMTCSNWSSASLEQPGRLGSSHDTNSDWTDNPRVAPTTRACSSDHHLYCFEGD